MTEDTYSELNRMQAVHLESQTIGAFLDWLANEQGLTICRWEEPTGLGSGHYVPDYMTIEKRLAGYFEIDLDKAEEERVRMLESFRSKA